MKIVQFRYDMDSITTFCLSDDRQPPDRALPQRIEAKEISKNSIPSIPGEGCGGFPVKRNNFRCPKMCGSILPGLFNV
jgi:hypothetical protein